jgi:hypothetical protein
MNRFISILIFLMIVLSSCTRSIKVDALNDVIAQDDSFRLAKGLITMQTTWKLDTIEYGLIDSISNMWTNIEDTTKCTDFVIRKKYNLNDSEKTVEKRKIIEFNPKTNIKFNETDIYIKFNKKDSLNVDIIYSYDYLSNTYHCTVDTLDLKQQRKADKELKNLEERWNKIVSDTILIPCSTSYTSARFKLYNSFLKSKVLTKDEALIMIEKLRKK